MELICNGSTQQGLTIGLSSFVPVLTVSSAGILFLCVGCFVNERKHSTNNFRYLRFLVTAGTLMQFIAVISISVTSLESSHNAIDNPMVTSVAFATGVSVFSVGFSIVFEVLLVDSWRRAEKSLIKKLRDEHLLIILGMVFILELLLLSFWLVSTGAKGNSEALNTWCWIGRGTSGAYEATLALASQEKHWIAVILSSLLLWKTIQIRKESRCNAYRKRIVLCMIVVFGFASVPSALLLSHTDDMLYIWMSAIVLIHNVFVASSWFPFRNGCSQRQLPSIKESDQVSAAFSDGHKQVLQHKIMTLKKIISENNRTIRELKSKQRSAEADRRACVASSSTLHFLHAEQHVWASSDLLRRKCASDTALHSTVTKEARKQDNGATDGCRSNSESTDLGATMSARRHHVIDCGAGCYYVTDDDTSSDSESEWEPLCGAGPLRFQKHVKVIESVYKNGFADESLFMPFGKLEKVGHSLPRRVIRDGHNFVHNYPSDDSSDSSYEDCYQSIRLQCLRRSETLV